MAPKLLEDVNCVYY